MRGTCATANILTTLAALWWGTRCAPRIGEWSGDIAEAKLPDRFPIDCVRVYDLVDKREPRGPTMNRRIAGGFGLAIVSTALSSVFAAESSLTLKVVYDKYVFDESDGSDWGFSCVVTGTDKTILFDTGRKGEVLLANLKKMGVSPADVESVVISHNHRDHTGGLLTVLKQNRNVSVYLPKETPEGFAKDVKELAAGTTVVSQPVTICKGALVLGPMGDQIIEQSLVIDTDKGLVIITGCSHPGIEVIAKRAKEELNRDIYMILGGTHLLHHSEKDLQSVIDTLKELGVQKVAPSHCSGDKAIAKFQDAFGDRFIKMGVGRVVEVDTK